MFVSRKKFNEAIELIESMTRQMREAAKVLQRSQDLAHLVSIERDGRLVKFTFVRNKQFYTIETMGLMSDNMKEWKDVLLR